MDTSSFLDIVVAILGNQPEINELPSNKLTAFSHEGDVVEEEISRELLLKVARLQTLAAQVQNKSSAPDYAELKQIADLTGTDFLTAASNSLMTQEDAVYRVMMLERIIVEVVREALPKECSKFDVRYLLRTDRKIVRLQASRHRFLD